MGSLIFKSPYKELGFPGGSDSKESAHNVGWSLSQGDPLEKEVATYSGILAWRIPWTEEPGRLQSMGLQRVRHNWETNTHTHAVADVSRKSHTTDLFFFFFSFYFTSSLNEFVRVFPKGTPGWVASSVEIGSLEDGMKVLWETGVGGIQNLGKCLKQQWNFNVLIHTKNDLFFINITIQWGLRRLSFKK